jgi:plasmid stabilization system protein ParE
MSRKIIVSSSALRDIQQGIDYYKLQANGLGKRFEKVIHSTFTRIQHFPFAASFAYEQVRYKVIEKFPYIILYTFDDKHIYVIRVFNTYRSPEKYNIT